MVAAARAMTRREAQVLALALHGYDPQASATVLGIGRRTVESHRSSLARRFGVASLAELFRIISVHGLAQFAAPIEEGQP